MILLIVLLFSCKNENHREITEKEATKEIVNLSDSIFTKKYLSEGDIRKYIANTEIYEFTNNYPYPFDSIKFNKVIAYDFDGNEEPYSHIINLSTQKFAPVILHQNSLNKNQIDFLINFITDNKTYGESTAACFIPHLGIVFFENNNPIYCINVCLDCNYLISTTTIPATQHKMYKSEYGEYALHGFTDYGKQSIINLCKELDLDYGDRTIKK